MAPSGASGGARRPSGCGTAVCRPRAWPSRRGTPRLWNVEAGSAGDALLLGPLAVDSRCRNLGIGAALMRHAIAEAERLGPAGILLVGDEAYYGRFGFSREAASRLRLRGPVDISRFLGLELRPDALSGATGLLRPTGRLASVPVADRLTA